MNILVIGSLGTLGIPLVKKLRENGHTVFEADLFHSKHENYTRTDIREYRQVEKVFNKHYDLVYHLAAEFGRINGEEYYENLWETNVIGTRHILEIQKTLDFKMVFASSSEAYGNLDVDFVSEDVLEKLPADYNNDYSITKRVNELQIQRFNKLYNTQNMICRFFNAYGPYEFYTPYRSVVCLFCYRIMHDLPITVYKNYHRVFMYIDDFINTLSNIPENFVANEIVNIGGTEYTSVEYLSNVIHDYLGKKQTNVIYLDKETANVTNKRPNIQKAIKLLNHNPITKLVDGIPKTIEWMKKHDLS